MQGYRRSRDGYWGISARESRLKKSRSQSSIHTSGVSADESNRPKNQERKAAAARTRQLKNCRSSQQMLSTLRDFGAQSARPLDTVHLGTVFTRMPTFGDSDVFQGEVAKEVQVDVQHAIERQFAHPFKTGQMDIQGLTNVAWGLIKMGLDNQAQCQQCLGILDEQLDKCNPTDLAMAIDCFDAARYRSARLNADRLVTILKSKLRDASSQDLSRYLYTCRSIGVHDKRLLLEMGERLSQIVAKPQHCSNSMLSLAREGVDAEETAQCLAEKMLELQPRATPQAVANCFLACFERGWYLEKQLAVRLVCHFAEDLDRATPYGIIQVLAGLERHDLRNDDADLTPLVSKLLRTCPEQLYPKLGAVLESMKVIGLSTSLTEKISDLHTLAHSED